LRGSAGSEVWEEHAMILVTGATGKVGRPLVKDLQAAGARFKIGARAPEKVPGEAVHFDLDRPETFGPALKGIDRLFLLSSGGTQRETAVVDAAKKAGVGHIVKLSVWNAEKDAFTFGRIHREVEKAIEASGVPWTFLRPNSFMQNFLDSHAPAIRAQGAFYPYGHQSKMSVVDTRDVGAVAAKTLTQDGHAGKAYRLSGPEALTNQDMADALSRATGKTIRFVDLPDAQYVEALVAAGLPRPYAEGLGDISRYWAAGASEPVTPDVERVTGRKPIAFEQFARENAAAWK
jgi:uncharacterized protein YbjT (DUF2867 family)